ncbi:MAG TPA: branched-chain amino acid transaminase [Blastocatellia bacterium]|nr:branched-chain amino acid transaminase [Blastocatellia bacterium]
MSFEGVKYLWMNGEIKPWAEGTIHVATHALHYGSGIFEGIRCYDTVDGPAIFRLPPHLDRFYASGLPYRLKIPYSPAELEAAMCELIVRNDFTDCYIRPIAFYGLGRLGVNPKGLPVDVAIMVWRWGTYLGEEGLTKGVRVKFVSMTKIHQSMIPTTAKACGNYLNSLLAVCEATEEGYDEGILINRDGYISEGSGENLFIIKDGVIRTNDADSSILMGITRDTAIQLARDLGYKVEIGYLKPEDLVNCDEAFFTGTAAEITPVREVDNQAIGTGERGPITTEIQELFFRVVRGQELRYREWLTPVQVAQPVAS